MKSIDKDNFKGRRVNCKIVRMIMKQIWGVVEERENRDKGGKALCS